MKKTGYVVLACSIVLAALPLLSMLVASFAAYLLGCTFDEGSVSQCPTVFGDIGELLYTMGVSGWFVFYTIPIGLGGLFLSVILFIISFFQTRKTGA